MNNGAGDVPLYAVRARDVCGEEPVLRSNECSVQLSLVLKRGVILPAACLESTRNESASLLVCRNGQFPITTELTRPALWPRNAKKQTRKNILPA